VIAGQRATRSTSPLLWRGSTRKRSPRSKVEKSAPSLPGRWSAPGSSTLVSPRFWNLPPRSADLWTVRANPARTNG